MNFWEVWALLATAGLLGLAVRLWIVSHRKTKWSPPAFDPKRYQIVQHYAGETREIWHGLDPLKARHAYEQAPLQAGVVVEFYEFGKCRGKREA